VILTPQPEIIFLIGGLVLSHHIINLSLLPHM